MKTTLAMIGNAIPQSCPAEFELKKLDKRLDELRGRIVRLQNEVTGLLNQRLTLQYRDGKNIL